MATRTTSSAGATRESVPFRVRTADGTAIELSYSSPRPAETHDELALLGSLPWFEPGKPLRNYMLHETDFSESHRFAIAGLHCATLELVRDSDD